LANYNKVTSKHTIRERQFGMHNLSRSIAGAVAVMAAVMVSPTANAASGAGGLPVGWNYIDPSYCYQYPNNGYTILYVYPAAGGYLWTYEQDLVAAISTFCANGNNFYVYSSTGSNWVASYLVPGL